MGHLIKYRFLQTVRERGTMFWAVAFPIILGSLFSVSFGNTGAGDEMAEIPAAVVTVGGSTESEKAFTEFLTGLDGDMLRIQKMDEKKAVQKLKNEEVSGIFYVKEEPSLTVSQSGIDQSILKAMMDSYCRNAALIQKVASSHPERLQQTLASLANWKDMTEEISPGGKTTDANIQYFFALIAFACISGAYLGLQASIDGQANLSALGARRSVTPTHKLALVVVDMLVLFIIHFMNIMILTFYIRFVLGVNLGDDWAGIIVVNMFGSMIGVSLGILIGCIGRFSETVKMGMTVTTTLVCGFMAGLMIAQMKDVVEHYVPILNRINPAAVLSDAMYCMGVYENPKRFAQNLVILGVMSLICIVAAFWSIRRERYDSI